MVKGIIFDMGGVLIDLDLERCWKNFEELIGFKTIKEFVDPCHQRAFYAELEAGRITEHEFYAECKKYCWPGVTDDQVAYCFGSLLRDIRPEKVGLLKELAKKYDLYMLSNNNPVTMRECSRIFKEAGIPLEDNFKGLFISWEMKMLKPGAEIYMESIRRTGHKAEELCFIDDSPKNVEAARKCGIKSALYVQGTDLRATVESLL